MISSLHGLRVKSGLQSSSDLADREISCRKAAMTSGGTCSLKHFIIMVSVENRVVSINLVFGIVLASY